MSDLVPAEIEVGAGWAKTLGHWLSPTLKCVPKTVCLPNAGLAQNVQKSMPRAFQSMHRCFATCGLVCDCRVWVCCGGSGQLARALQTMLVKSALAGRTGWAGVGCGD